MLREEYIAAAAAVHAEGARTLRDSAAALLPGCSVYRVKTAFMLQSVFTDAERLLCRALELSAGLLERSSVSKYTAVIEARMRLMGVESDASVSAKQTACERTKSVAPGTRGDIYDGLTALSRQAETLTADFLRIAETLIADMREGLVAFAIPLCAVRFLHRINADYAAAAKALANGEYAQLVRRTDAFDAYETCLRPAAHTPGVEAAENASADTLAALAAGGLIPALPPVLFDILLRYEDLPATIAGTHAEPVEAVFAK